MPTDTRKSDLRIVKTAKVLNAAMFALLARNNFGKITVRDICEEAQISRATFYARFDDKYDFLKSWLINLYPDGIDINEAYEKIEKMLNDFIYKNKAVIKNLICDTDEETLRILTEFVLSVFNFAGEGNDKGMYPGQVVLSNFFAGGMIFYFQWQVKNRFPAETTPMNIYLYDIIRKLREWGMDTI